MTEVIPNVKRWFCKCGKVRMVSVMNEEFPSKHYLKEVKAFQKAGCKSDIITLKQHQKSKEKWCFDCKL